MNAKKRSYWLVFHARASEQKSAKERHAEFFDGIKGLSSPWGIRDELVPPAPEFGRSSTAVINLRKCFAGSVKRAMVSYKYRRMLSDDGLSDDTLSITFNSAKVDVHYLVYSVIPVYIEAFDAYLVEYFDDKLIDLAWEEKEEEGRILFTAKSNENFNTRYNVKRLNVVSFFDELLCRRAFHLSPTEVSDRLQRTAEQVQLIHGGVYIVGTSQILAPDDALNICNEMTIAVAE